MIVCVVNLHPGFSYDQVSLSATTTFSRWVVYQVSFQQDQNGYQELINLLLLASTLFLASFYSDSKEKSLRIVWAVVIFQSQTRICWCLVM